MSNGILGFDSLMNTNKIEIKKIYTTSTRPCLFLIETDGCEIKCTSTWDVEFYKEFCEAACKVKDNKVSSDSQTKEILEAGVKKVLKQFDYPREIYQEGAELYLYDKICMAQKKAEIIREKSLYDWKEDFLENLRCLGCVSFDNVREDWLYVRLTKKNKKIMVIVYNKLKLEYKKYFIINGYFSLIFSQNLKGDKDAVFLYYNLSNSKSGGLQDENIPCTCETKDGTLGEIVKEFNDDILHLSRELVLPYEKFMRSIKKYESMGYDEYKILDKLCEKYLYPRFEIKTRIDECRLIEKFQGEFICEFNKGKKRKVKK